MVRLDRYRRSLHRDRLDHVGVNGPLPKPFHIFDAVRLFVEHVDECLTDGLAFRFRISEVFQRGIKLLLRIHAFDIQAQALVGREYLFELSFTKKSIVNENAVEVLADCFRDEGCGHGRIDTTRQRHHNLVIT